MGKKKGKEQNLAIRSPICTHMGHVDHGKSSILDRIRGTAIVDSEPGKITQSIGASIVPLDTIKKICGKCLSPDLKFTIPSLLFIDTPGHAAFSNLRKRGGNLADIAVLVIDINEGFKPQTIEALEILKSYKTPFVVAANKIDLVNSYLTKTAPLLENLKAQLPQVQQMIETKIYEIVGKLAEYGFESERFDRVSDFTKQVAIVPCCARSGEGIPELLMIVSGLAQRFLENTLQINVDGPAKGTILEVKEEKGLGTTLNVIIYDGTLRVGDTLVIGGVDDCIVTKVKAMFQPAPLAEMRDKKAKFKSVKSVTAAIGVKVSGPDIDGAIAGMPVMSATPEDVDKVKDSIRKELDEVLLKVDPRGVIIKADTLGSLEALERLLRENDFTVRKASIGNISKKDVMEAEANSEKDPLDACVLGFNVEKNPDVKVPDNIKILTNEVIYRLIEDFQKWREEEIKRQQAKGMDKLVRPVKLEFMRNYVFRNSNPAVIGVDIIAGKLKTNMQLMNKEGKYVSTVKSIQHEKESKNEVDEGKQVAVSLDGVTVGRQINEGDIFYSQIPENDFRELKKFKQHLSKKEIAVIKEIAEIMRKNNPVWGV